MLNFLQMKYFMAVVEAGSFSAASRNLHISQQALSSQIAQIESEIGIRLFERTRPLTITEAGRRFYEASAQILYIRHTLDLNLEDLSAAADRRIRLGVSSAYTKTFLPVILPKFLDQFPDVRIDLYESTWASIYDLLVKRKTDMILFQPPSSPDIVSVPVSSSELSLYAPFSSLRAHFGPRAKEVAEALRERPLPSLLEKCPIILPRTGNVRNVCDNLFLRENYVPNIRMETEFLETAAVLCKSGLGITFAPRDFMERLGLPIEEAQNDIYPMDPHMYRRSLSLCYLKETPLTRSMKGLIRIFREEFSQSL